MSTPEPAADHHLTAPAKRFGAQGLEVARIGTKRAAAACLAALLIAIALPPAVAQAPGEACEVPSYLVESGFGLPHVAERLRRSEPIKIVALGSSSTEGVGASRPDATYPSRLAAELRQRWPNVQVTVINKGVSGEQARQMIARFERDVIAERPDLLIWQTGTNSALAEGNIEALVEDIDRGIDLAHSAGIDVLLMTPQHSPQFEKVRNRNAYLDNIAVIAAVNRVPVLRRYEMMKHWIESGQMTGSEMINPDGLHLTDRSYFCLGRTAAHLVATLAGATARTPIASGR